MLNLGRLTVKGSVSFEKRLSGVLNDISLDIKALVHNSLYESIVLIGGYGRGEGGVIKLEGIEYPHNNFDFLVISKNISNDESNFLNSLCKSIFDTHTKKLGIFSEFTVITKSKFKMIDPLVITYDMKYGHKVIAGNENFFKDDNRFEVESIPSWDIRNLLVNRGTLLIINDLILEKEKLSLKDEKTIIKHWIKAIIGYGDSLLFYLGEYNYSYLEKQKRMQKQACVSPKFKALYDKAMEFRFEPKYDRYKKFNLKKYHRFLKKELEKIHFQCERLALDNINLDSKDYILKAIDQSLLDNNSLKANLKKVLSLIKNVPKISSFSLRETFKYKMLGPKGMMPILFPFIAYGMKVKEVDLILNDFFQINDKAIDLKNKYLTYWKTYVNSNFQREDFDI